MTEFQPWQIGPSGQNYFKISVVTDDDSFDTLKFEIQFEGQEFELEMNEYFCQILTKEIDRFVKILKINKDIKKNGPK